MARRRAVRAVCVTAANQAIFAFAPAALGLAALIRTVAAVQTAGTAIVPGCAPEIAGFRAAILMVRIHLPPAASQQRTGPPAEASVSKMPPEQRHHVRWPTTKSSKRGFAGSAVRETDQPLHRALWLSLLYDPTTSADGCSEGS